MKAFSIIMKILAAAAAIVGAVYVAATYEDTAEYIVPFGLCLVFYLCE